ncbi:MAG TPA: hypothetical protein VH396_05810 [Chitinophagaceae bacterium]|jgi:hypothetical protein
MEFFEKELREKILQTIQTGEHRKLGDNALQTFKAYYTLEIAAEKYYDAFKNTIL